MQRLLEIKRVRQRGYIGREHPRRCARRVPCPATRPPSNARHRSLH